MVRIGFTGVPGAGKTSLARGVASSCRGIQSLKNLELCAEYARRYIAQYGSIESIWEQYRILNKQVNWENAVGEVDLLITDSPVFMGLAYASLMNTRSEKDAMILGDIFKALTKLDRPEPRYDIIFHLPPKLQPVDDGVRPKSNFDPEWRRKMDSQITSVFTFFCPKLFHVVQADTVEERVEECINIIKGVYDVVPA
ncbi:MAG: AAA family ATPase [Candidatus Izemoplasmatales bacterium]|jgi:nicotinamide riboside kinase